MFHSRLIIAAVVATVVCSACDVAGKVIDPATTDPPEISAQSGILVDAQSGIVLWDRHPNRRMYPASVTKMMTGLLCVEKGDLDAVVEIRPSAASVGEASLNLAPHEQLTLRQLLKGLMIKSANDAAVAIAEHIAGDLDSFVAMMNRRAEELGMDDTHFENPHGLHSDNHYTTAADLAKLARAVMASPKLAEIVNLEEDIIPWPGKEWARELVNRNRLLLDWDACDGIKTGWTTEAGRCLAASATVEGWRLICIVLDCEDAWTDAETLLKWGFHQYRREPVITKGSTSMPGTVRRGTRRQVSAVAAQSVILPVPDKGDPPEPEVDLSILQAPVERGQAVGSLFLSYRGHQYRVPLVAAESVPKSFWARAMDSYIPQGALIVVLALSVGVLIHGAVTKIVIARRNRLQKGGRRSDRSRPGEPQWRDRH